MRRAQRLFRLAHTRVGPGLVWQGESWARERGSCGQLGSKGVRRTGGKAHWQSGCTDNGRLANWRDDSGDEGSTGFSYPLSRITSRLFSSLKSQVAEVRSLFKASLNAPRINLS